MIYRASPSTEDLTTTHRITLDARYPEDDRPEQPLVAGLHELCFPMNADVSGVCNCGESLVGGFDHDFELYVRRCPPPSLRSALVIGPFLSQHVLVSASFGVCVCVCVCDIRPV